MPNRTNSSPGGFAEIVSQVLTEAFRESCTPAMEALIASVEPASLPGDQQTVWFCLHLAGSVEGRAYLAVKTADIAALGLREVASTQEAEIAALLRLLQSKVPRLQELAVERYGALTMTMEQATRPALSGASTTAISAQAEAGDVRAMLSLCLEPQLVTGLQRVGGMLFPEAVTIGQPSAENLGLVLDVELNATLRFGQRQLSLREILDLTSGSVVELDRQVDEPVDLILDGRVIARGEAVIIDGTYGMRITEVLQPMTGVARSR